MRRHRNRGNLDYILDKPFIKITVRYWDILSSSDILNTTEVISVYLQVKIWGMQKSMNKEECTHNLLPRDKVLMDSLTTELEASFHLSQSTHLKG